MKSCAGEALPMTPTPEEHWELLRTLSSKEGPLRIDGATATVSWPDAYVGGAPLAQRRRLHKEILENLPLPPEVDRPRVLMTAGPPGAGKSRIVREELVRLGLRDDECLTVDPDAMKDELLKRLVVDGSYRERLLPKEVLQAEGTGHRFFPREMAALVHEESSQLAKDLLRQAMDVGCHIVIDGVMANLRSTESTLKRLSVADPDFAVTLLCVEVDKSGSRKRVQRRWQRGYEAALREVTNGSDPDHHLGGRFVPSEVNETIYDRKGPSACVRVAQDVASNHSIVTGYRFFITDEDEAPELVKMEDRAPGGGWRHLDDVWRLVTKERT
ncbi:zeta toxin family protein [Ornithinimicrobium sp. LYQ103]|uniref:zeta toxin family protein n=1 Tax=Ornithinimicrobium sp. LYQ103 TaxID=3378796 RepID=UPI00385307FB